MLLGKERIKDPHRTQPGLGSHSDRIRGVVKEYAVLCGAVQLLEKVCINRGVFLSNTQLPGGKRGGEAVLQTVTCLLYTSPSPRDRG